MVLRGGSLATAANTSALSSFSLFYGALDDAFQRNEPLRRRERHLPSSIDNSVTGDLVWLEEVELSGRKVGVTDGTRTRNSQNHNLGLYH